MFAMLFKPALPLLLLPLLLAPVCHAQGMYYGVGSGELAAEPALGQARGPARPVLMRAQLSTRVARAPQASGQHPGLDYVGSLRFDSVALMADYPLWRELRLSGGLLLSQPVLGTPDPRVEMRGRSVDLSSYLGLGFGDAQRQAEGWNVFGDVGWSLGKSFGPKPLTSPAASLSAGSVELEAAPAPLTPGQAVVKLRAAPAVKLGASLRF